MFSVCSGRTLSHKNETQLLADFIMQQEFGSEANTHKSICMCNSEKWNRHHILRILYWPQQIFHRITTGDCIATHGLNLPCLWMSSQYSGVKWKNEFTLPGAGRALPRHSFILVLNLDEKKGAPTVEASKHPLMEQVIVSNTADTWFIASANGKYLVCQKVMSFSLGRKKYSIFFIVFLLLSPL